MSDKVDQAIAPFGQSTLDSQALGVFRAKGPVLGWSRRTAAESNRPAASAMPPGTWN